MPQQDNDNLEKFFRKATTSPDIEFNEDDWQRLKKKLDEKGSLDAAKYSRRRKILVSISIGLLFLSVLVLYFNFPDTRSKNAIAIDSASSLTAKDSDTNNQIRHKDSPLVSDPSPDQKKDDASNRVVKSDSKPLTTINSQSKKRQRTQKITSVASENIFNRDRISDSIIKEEESVLSDKVQSANTSQKNLDAETLHPIKLNKQLENQDLSKVTLIDANAKTEKRTSSNDNLQIASEPTEINSLLIPSNSKEVVKENLSESDTINTQLTLTAKTQSDSMTTENSKGKKNSMLMPSKWNIVFSLSPDFSSARLSQYTAPGTIGGFAVHYQLTNRFSIGTGVLYSHKRYAANTEDYQVPEGFWGKKTNGVIPNKIDGSCDLLDFRLKVQYRLVESRKSRLYISSGVSSYYFFEESYYFLFNQPNPGAMTKWESNASTRNLFLFATANFSIAYEYSLNNRFALGLEPSLNIPIQGIGWSNINLYSMGASLTMRYNFFRK